MIFKTLIALENREITSMKISHLTPKTPRYFKFEFDYLLGNVKIMKQV